MSGSKTLHATVETNKGNIRLKLFVEKTPCTVASFVNLCKRDFYKGLTFHRVIDDFMIQGGCPQGNGMGGPGYDFDDEFDENLRHDKAGILSMANSGPGTNGSQFFITYGPTSWLDGKHSVFGVVAGDEDMAVVNSIVQDDNIHNITIEGDCSELIESNKNRIDEWNSILDKK